ncbi:MAG TPA: AMP-binding protein [Streptosporangiaceae bacterium]|nr:AMP-binding protein [Streptosporangiaceae bacterium]
MVIDPIPRGGALAELIAGRARERGDAPALEDAGSDRVVSYRDLAGLVRRQGAALSAAAVPPGARVLLDVADPLDFSVAFLGVIAAGRCAVPVDPRAPEGELRRGSAVVRPAAMVGDQPERGRVLGIPVLPAAVRGGPGPEVPGPEVPGPEVPGAVLLLTSGSTGNPKAVELTEDRLLHVARAVAVHNQLSADDRGFSPLPLFHINAEVVALLASLVAGAALVLDSRFHRHGFWELLAERDITWVNAVPAIWTIVASCPVPIRPRRLRFVRSASAPLPVAVRDQVTALTGVPVVESYGMTEAASQITATPLDGTAPAGSCGRPVGTELEIRDRAGRRLPPGHVGGVWIRGAGVISGYADGRAAERFDADGWLDTRDMGYLDASGFLFLAGRSDDVINRGGEMLYPREIEEVLSADPGIRDAVVVGRADPVLGQVPVAYVIPVHGPETAGVMQDLLDRLTARCAAHLSRHKRPAAIYVVEDLPRAATGKIQRHRLRQPAGAAT